jgi:hypothetical protein
MHRRRSGNRSGLTQSRERALPVAATEGPPERPRDAGVDHVVDKGARNARANVAGILFQDIFEDATCFTILVPAGALPKRVIVQPHVREIHLPEEEECVSIARVDFEPIVRQAPTLVDVSFDALDERRATRALTQGPLAIPRMSCRGDLALELSVESRAAELERREILRGIRPQAQRHVGGRLVHGVEVEPRGLFEAVLSGREAIRSDVLPGRGHTAGSPGRETQDDQD